MNLLKFFEELREDKIPKQNSILRIGDLSYINIKELDLEDENEQEKLNNCLDFKECAYNDVIFVNLTKEQYSELTILLCELVHCVDITEPLEIIDLPKITKHIESFHIDGTENASEIYSEIEPFLFNNQDIEKFVNDIEECKTIYCILLDGEEKEVFGIKTNNEIALLENYIIGDYPVEIYFY